MEYIFLPSAPDAVPFEKICAGVQRVMTSYTHAAYPALP